MRLTPLMALHAFEELFRGSRAFEEKQFMSFCEVCLSASKITKAFEGTNESY